MTDHRLQTLRRTQAPGDLAFQSRLLTARMRAGELAPARVRLAAWLGDEAAQGVGFPAANPDERHWWAPFDDAAVLESLLAVVEWTRKKQVSNYGLERVAYWVGRTINGDPTQAAWGWPRSQGEALYWLREGLRGLPNGRQRGREAIAAGVVPWALGGTSRVEAIREALTPMGARCLRCRDQWLEPLGEGTPNRLRCPSCGWHSRYGCFAPPPISAPQPAGPPLSVTIPVDIPVTAAFLGALRRAFPEYRLRPLRELRESLRTHARVDLGVHSGWRARQLEDRAQGQGLSVTLVPHDDTSLAC